MHIPSPPDEKTRAATRDYVCACGAPKGASKTTNVMDWPGRVPGETLGPYAASAAASRASFSMRAQSPALTASAGATQEPPTQMTFFSLR